MPARQVVVNELEVIDFNLPDLTLRINCSKGTYIRSLANDIGQACESGAYLAGLRRTKIGSFQVEDANKNGGFGCVFTNKVVTCAVY